MSREDKIVKVLRKFGIVESKVVIKNEVVNISFDAKNLDTTEVMDCLAELRFIPGIESQEFAGRFKAGEVRATAKTADHA